ncbi:hypothetical protein SCLCIDRAFT_1209517 [Scleroderma citrinum Foug A]|uniref:Uncharacterized protein n=1 Tax=Scleroderma citrinum Foug A TaxID=1036808 RepID=A0A0C3EJP4_9AGAM|nr:hypothetical protein SCLCIDRAFT_1209517 [Scleroderma citrinum Foug A]
MSDASRIASLSIHPWIRSQNPVYYYMYMGIKKIQHLKNERHIVKITTSQHE